VETSLRFIPWQEEPAFFDLMRQASGFLDTIGFSGFNTAMQAVACNLPIVTMDGKFLRGRLASGILKRMGLDDLVVTSPAAYIALAERLVLDRDFNHMVRTRIEKAKSVLFEDTDSVRSLQEFLLDKCRGR
jgi:predicted O-linked N-acetylglucosamine transferase (SPINDLY family)